MSGHSSFPRIGERAVLGGGGGDCELDTVLLLHDCFGMENLIVVNRPASPTSTDCRGVENKVVG